MAPAPLSQAAFDSLSAAASGRAPSKTEAERPASLEVAAAREPLRLFAQTVEPCELGLLDSGHLVLFRRAWRDGERLIQGALIEPTPFLQTLIGLPFQASTLAATSQLSVAYRDAALAVFGSQADPRAGAAGNGLPLHRARPREPFGGLELRFAARHLPTPPGVALIGWMAAALALVLLAGIGFMYRLGMRHLALVRQQQDFVAAVSHELKTPLTSIRLYADMLAAGFASADRVPIYYRFILEESERLSRLIANILQLARIERAALTLEPRPVALGALLEQVRARVAAQLERAGFRLELHCPEEIQVVVDVDAFLQILLNLVDNAIKYAAGAAERTLAIAGEPAPGGRVIVRVRDFGPGVPRDQRQRVFRLFERGEQARRQAIAGTGIGLALVKALTEAMGGQVTLVPRDPGVEFRIDLPGE